MTVREVLENNKNEVVEIRTTENMGGLLESGNACEMLVELPYYEETANILDMTVKSVQRVKYSFCNDTYIEIIVK